VTPALPTQPDLARVLDRAVTGRRPWLLLTVLCLLLWLPGFFTLPPSDRDESRFAQATKQMTETGDYVQIRNGLVARNQKPIGIYWLQVPFVLAARAAGLARSNPIWPYRIPSLLGGLLAVLATYGFGRRVVGAPAALLGAVFLAASVVLTVEVHMAKTDAALLAATTLAMGLLSRAWLDPAGLRRGQAALFWIALGVAILIKGPIAPMVCALTALWLALVDRQRGRPRWLLALRPKTGIWLLLAIVLPWCIAIALATHGRFFAQSLGGDLAGKLAGSDDAHGAPIGVHLLLLPLLLFAGGGAALCAIPSTWRDRKLPEIRFLIAWIVPSWLVFEVVATKLPHYTLPLYPAVALLAARWMLRPPDRTGLLARLATGLAIGLASLIGLAGAALPFVVQPGLSDLDLLGVPVLAVSVLLVWLLWRIWPDPRRAALRMLGAAPLLYVSLFGIELPLLRPLWIAPQVTAALRARGQAQFGELGFAEPSLMFLAGTQTRLFGNPSDAASFLAASPDHVLLVNNRDLAALTARLRADGTVAAPFSVVTGYNYSRGRSVALTLLSATPAQRMK
jgi:4-amino-4-deoxy-L-arabinose transferase-like glycosyltransferase